MDKVRVGIIGIGNMGTTHMKNICEGKIPNMIVTAICDKKEERCEFVRKTYNDVLVYDNVDQMLDCGKLDAVLIAVPHYEHPDIAIKAFKKGLHVLTEKPAGVYTKQVLEMNEVAKQSGKIFGIMYNQRTNPIYQKLREMIQRGDLGEIKRVNWTITDWYRSQCYHDSASWRSTWKDEGGGTLINQNPHQLDLWQWLFGMPEKIMSFCSFGKYYNIETEDDVTAFMKYKNGMTGVYITSTGETPGVNRLEIACDMGSVVLENNKISFKRNIVSEREFNKYNKLPFGTPEYWDCNVPASNDAGEQHIGILKNFADAVIKGTPLLAPGEEGVFGLTISNAIHYSAWTEKWVDIEDFPHEEFYELLNDKVKNSKYVKKTQELGVQNTEGTY